MGNTAILELFCHGLSRDNFGTIILKTIVISVIWLSHFKNVSRLYCSADCDVMRSEAFQLK